MLEKKDRRNFSSVRRIIRFPSEKMKTLYCIEIFGVGGRNEILNKSLLVKRFKMPLKASFFIKSPNGRSNGPRRAP